jgi:hypothetical protein
MNIINDLTKPTTTLRITLTTPSPKSTVIRDYTMPFGAEAYKGLEVISDWWRIKTNDPRVQIKGMRLPGPRSVKNREQE